MNTKWHNSDYYTSYRGILITIDFDSYFLFYRKCIKIHKVYSACDTYEDLFVYDFNTKLLHKKYFLGRYDSWMRISDEYNSDEINEIIQKKNKNRIITNNLKRIEQLKTLGEFSREFIYYNLYYYG